MYLVVDVNSGWSPDENGSKEVDLGTSEGPLPRTFSRQCLVIIDQRCEDVFHPRRRGFCLEVPENVLRRENIRLGKKMF